MNHLITAILQCARGRASDPVPGWINAPVLPAMPVVDAEGGEDDAEESAEPEVISGALPVLGAQAEEEDVTALRGGRWIGRSSVCSSLFWPVLAQRLRSRQSLPPRESFDSPRSRRIDG